MGLFNFIFGNKKKEEQLRLERERQVELQRRENERIAREREERLVENKRKSNQLSSVDDLVNECLKLELKGNVGELQNSFKFEVIESNYLSEADKEAIKEAYITQGDYGLSVRFNLKEGCFCFIPLSTDCIGLYVGDYLDLDKIKILTLKRNDEIIQRVGYDK